MNNLERTEEQIAKAIYLNKNSNMPFQAISLKVDDKYAIYYNPKKLTTSKERNTALAHEHYHCKFDCMYTFNDSLQTRKRREFKANYQMALDIIPPEDLKLMLNSMPVWEISDFMDLTEEFINDTIRIYRSKGLL